MDIPQKQPQKKFPPASHMGSEKREVPIPHILSVHLAFIDPNLEMAEFEREVRRIIREKLEGVLPAWILPDDDVEIMEEYDDWLRDVIREELLRN